MKGLNSKGTFQKYNLHLINGDVIVVEEDYFLPWDKGLIESLKMQAMIRFSRLSICSVKIIMFRKRVLFTFRPVQLKSESRIYLFRN